MHIYIKSKKSNKAMIKLLQLSYLRSVMLVLLLGTIFTTAKSQTTLVAGDIAFTGYNSDLSAGADEFAFVITRSGGIASGTIISFTDNGWLSGSSALATNESVITWTAGTALAQGVQVKIVALVATVGSSTNGTVVLTSGLAGGLNLVSTGDQVLAFQGASTSPTFIAGIHMNVATVAGDGFDSNATVWDGTLSATTNRSARPPGLTTGTTAIWFTTEVDNARFKCLTLSGTAFAIATIVNTTTNWDVDDITPFTLPCVAVATPSIVTSGTLSAFTTCAGTESTQQSFTVSGSNLTANIVVTPPTGFEVSTTSGSGFTSSVTLTQSGGTVSSTTIYARLTTAATGTPSGNITCASTGATTQNVAASGTVNASTTWNGTTWSNCTPSSTVDAILASSTAPSGFTCKALTINSGVALTTTGITATIHGNITNNGNGIAGTGNLVIAANAALAGTAFSFSGNLTVNTGAILTTNDKLTLVSDATNTARVGNSAGSISGNVTVQRYIPGGRRVFRFLAHPFTANLAISSLTDNIDITGTGGSPFTTTQTNSPSAFTYNNATANSASISTDPGWQGLTAGSTFDTKAGYRVLVRGTKGQTNSLNGGAYTPAAVTLDWTGTLNSGNQVFTLPNGGTGKSYSLVGNPYASPVDLSLVTRGSNINANFSVWNAQAGSRGAYITNAFSSSYILPSGAAFFAQTSANSNNTITFTEASKSNGTAATLFRSSNSGDQSLKILVTDWQHNYYDQLQFLFNNSNNSYTKDFDELWDGEKLMNPDFNLYSIASSTKALAIDRRPITLNDSVQLGVYSSEQNSYLLTVQELPYIQNGHIYLKDKWLNTLTLLQQNQTLTINCTNDAASQGTNRFELVFRTASALSTNFVNVAAQQKGSAIEVTFNTANETNMHSYEVEESKDGSTFTKGTTLEAKNAATNNYSWLDATVHNGNNYYRIKAIEKNGATKYSQVVRVNIGTKRSEFTVYPNPVKGGTINLQLTDIKKGVYTVKVVNNLGQEIAARTITHNGGSATQTINIGNAPTGKYNMVITNGTTTVTKTVIVE
jgi:hypothetical protein